MNAEYGELESGFITALSIHLASIIFSKLEFIFSLASKRLYTSWRFKYEFTAPKGDERIQRTHPHIKLTGPPTDLHCGCVESRKPPNFL